MQSFRYIALLLLSMLVLAQTGASQQDQEILDYYVQRATATFETRDPLARGVAFSYLATTIEWQLNREGKEQSVDSIAMRYYYSFGQLDSMVTEHEARDGIEDVDLTIPNVFEQEYEYNFFPNDSGGSLLSLGYDTESPESQLPVGIVTIDRKLYYVHSLHMVYPEKEGFERFSRTVETSLEDGYVFPLLVTVVAGRRGILFTEYYRRKTTISELSIIR